MSYYFIAIQASYNTVEGALYQGPNPIQAIIRQGAKASSHLIPLIDELLASHHLSLSSLTFIAINRGPGAFTSLRVSIATVNGIAFAHKIPLVGVDGLEALYYDTVQHNPPTLCLLNAYNNDVYFALYTPDLQKSGCTKIDHLLEELKKSDYPTLLCTGNGATLHRSLLVQELGQKAIFPDPIQEVGSVNAVAQLAIKTWATHPESKTIYKLAPNYMKTQAFAVTPTPKK